MKDDTGQDADPFLVALGDVSLALATFAKEAQRQIDALKAEVARLKVEKVESGKP